MAIFKCKMCGGDLALTEDRSVAQCEYCGSVQTVPSADNEKKLTLFGRANRLRAACEFDKAAGIYEAIVADFPEEAEAYWGLVLCKYGIEYVDDPVTAKKIPTCHRSSFDSVMDDSDFEQVLENADSLARKVYRDEAKQLEEIRKGIIAASANEEPYDIFICYKETDEKGERTLDSVLAQDLYDALTDKGYRVFFSRISLEDKLGVEYEPYIFAALNSAKVMLVFGTDYEYFNAVWVKNEWSRFLKLMAENKEKHLIPCFKGIDAYDMPKEFAKLQAQDMGKVGAIQDLLRGIGKLIEKNGPVATVAIGANGTETAPMLKRIAMFLEDCEWERADAFCEQILNIDPECAEAYLGKLMAELHVKKQEELNDCLEPFDDSYDFQKAMQFADENLRIALSGYIDHINARKENDRLAGVYKRATDMMQIATTEEAYREVAQLLESISGYMNAADLAQIYYEKAEEARKDAIYSSADQIVGDHDADVSIVELAEIVENLQTISGWKDTAQRIVICQQKLDELNAKEEAKRIEQEHKIEEARKSEIRRKAINKFGGKEQELMEALELLESISGWRDTDYQIELCQRKLEECRLMAEAERILHAEQESKKNMERMKKQRIKRVRRIVLFIVLGAVVIVPIGAVTIRAPYLLPLEFAITLGVWGGVIPSHRYKKAVSLMKKERYKEAIVVFKKIQKYNDSEKRMKTCALKILQKEKECK